MVGKAQDRMLELGGLFENPHCTKHFKIENLSSILTWLMNPVWKEMYFQYGVSDQS